MRFLFFGDWGCGIEELGGYAIGDESIGIVYVGGEEGNVGRYTWGSGETRRAAARLSGVSDRVSTGSAQSSTACTSRVFCLATKYVGELPGAVLNHDAVVVLPGSILSDALL